MPQVLIKVLIAEVTHDRSDDLGADFSVLNVRTERQGHRPWPRTSATPPRPPPPAGCRRRRRKATSPPPSMPWPQADKLDVLSRPYILTSDNQEATHHRRQGSPLHHRHPHHRHRPDDQHDPVPGHRHHSGRHAAHQPRRAGHPRRRRRKSASSPGQTVPISQGVAAPVFAKRSAQSRVGHRRRPDHRHRRPDAGPENRRRSARFRSWATCPSSAPPSRASRTPRPRRNC